MIPLTRKQKAILWAGAACLGLLTMWVPWKAAGKAQSGGAAGYGFIFYPPRDHLVVDTTRLLAPMAVVGIVTGLAVAFTGPKKNGGAQ